MKGRIEPEDATTAHGKQVTVQRTLFDTGGWGWAAAEVNWGGTVRLALRYGDEATWFLVPESLAGVIREAIQELGSKAHHRTFETLRDIDRLGRQKGPNDVP